MSGAWARDRRPRPCHGEYPSEFSTWVTGCWKVINELTKQGTFERLTSKPGRILVYSAQHVYNCSGAFLD